MYSVSTCLYAVLGARWLRAAKVRARARPSLLACVSLEYISQCCDSHCIILYTSAYGSQSKDCAQSCGWGQQERKNCLLVKATAVYSNKGPATATSASWEWMMVLGHLPPPLRRERRFMQGTAAAEQPAGLLCRNVRLIGSVYERVFVACSQQLPMEGLRGYSYSRRAARISNACFNIQQVVQLIDGIYGMRL